MTPTSSIETKTITLGHSPDPDDAFMFYALASGRIETGPYRFEHILQDIQTLNERATRGELDVTAVSIHAYAYLQDRYALLPSGASMGDNYGPMLVQREIPNLKFQIPKEEGRDEAVREFLKGKRIAIPGTMTSAFLSLQLFLGRKLRQASPAGPCACAEEPCYVVVPFDEIFEAVKSGRADVGLIIHEGQLTYAAEGFELLLDLGRWWFRETDGLPLPLGGNVIHKRFAPEERKRISDLLTQSIRYSLEHRQPAVLHSLKYGRGLDEALADRFVGMYVNDLTVDYGDRGRRGITEFLTRAHAMGLIPHRVELEFVV
ncbi:MAG: MqnA/MqnD/SBP family protein [Verrucomicrobiae bacterium]|nr:MqnA/MqnD/SBP family protein [Verrucomicrobiae bacterium]